MSKNESPDSIAMAPKVSGLREARCQAPKPPDENPKTPAIRASSAIGPVRAVDVRDDVVQHVLLEVPTHRRVHPLAVAVASPAVRDDDDQRSGADAGEHGIEDVLDRRRPSAPVGGRLHQLLGVLAEGVEQVRGGIPVLGAFIARRQGTRTGPARSDLAAGCPQGRSLRSVSGRSSLLPGRLAAPGRRHVERLRPSAQQRQAARGDDGESRYRR